MFGSSQLALLASADELFHELASDRRPPQWRSFDDPTNDPLVLLAAPRVSQYPHERFSLRLHAASRPYPSHSVKRNAASPRNSGCYFRSLALARSAHAIATRLTNHAY